MKRLFFAFSLLIIYSCSNTKKEASKISDFISHDASTVLKIDHIESFKADWVNNHLASVISGSKISSQVNKQLKNLEYLNTTSPVLISFDTHKDSLTYVLSTQLNDSLFIKEGINSEDFQYKIIDSVLVISNDKNELNNLTAKQNNQLEKLLKTSTNDKSFSIILDNERSLNAISAFIPNQFSEFANHTILDTELAQDKILFNGIAISNDTLPKLTTVFNGTIPQENTIQHIVSNTADGYMSFSFDDFQILQDNLNRFKQTVSDSIFNPEIFQTINEVAQIYKDDTNILVLKSIDVSATKEALRDHQNSNSNYRTIPIYEFSDSSFFNSVFNPILSINAVHHYSIIDEYFVFSDSEDALKDIISNYQNRNTIASNEAYKNAMLHLSDEASIVSVSNSKRLKTQLEHVVASKINSGDTKAYQISVFQLIKDDHFTHINGVIQKHKARTTSNAISEEFNVTLDADIIMDPHFVTNHRTKGKEIVVQDVNNRLYLISSSGKILWKKQLNGNILGRVQQIDMYKNGRLQLAFATPKRVYVIDRNGNDVSQFPLKFNDAITQPLSVFDYDNNKKYRLVVTQGSSLLLYDTKGKTVNGFNYKTVGDIKTQPKHFRINGKDYIVFAAGNSLQILDRRGKIRITSSDRFNFSKQPIFVYKNQFTTTDTSGNLIRVNLNGTSTNQHIGLETSHSIDASSKTLVTLTENKLSIKQNHLELDFGNYTTPKLFYLNDKIYVSLTDLQTQKIYLFDSQAKSIANFPVYGNSTIDLDNMDADRYLEFVTKGETNSIVVYEKN